MKQSLDSASLILKKEWSSRPEWWKAQSLASKLFPALCVLLYWGILFLLHGFRQDHLNIGLMIIFFWYLSPLSRKLFWFLLPFILTGIIYDSQRFYSDYIRGTVHVDWPYLFDKHFFGINTPEGRLTPNEYWQKHTYAVLDFITGFFYLFFIALYILVSAYQYFFLARTQKDPVLRRKTERLAPYTTWAFFWVNMIGYTTYYWFPAAPPWYVSMYGLGPAHMDAKASTAGCIRFDQLLGTHFFSEMYGRSADVFGAIPSLHVSYPFLAFLFAMTFKSLRVFCLLFYLIMVFSAIYLNHHYVIDILWGTSYALLVFFTIRFWVEKKTRSHF